jgi:hypothetical protein
LAMKPDTLDKQEFVRRTSDADHALWIDAQ